MIALPNMTVPTQFQAPPPLPQSAPASGSFGDYFANATTRNFNASNTLNGSTALSTSLPRWKTTAKNQSNPSSTAVPPNPQAAPTSVTGQTSSSSGSYTTGTSATGAPSTNPGPANTAQGQLAVPLGNGTTMQLGALGETALTAQFANLAASTSGQPNPSQTNRGPLQPGLASTSIAANQAGASLAAQGQAGVANATSSANQPALPRGFFTSPSLAAQAATSAANQFGTASASSTAIQSAGHGIAATANQVASAAATANQSSVQSAATSAAQANASNAQSGTGADGNNPSPPGAAELNASIVAGATMLAAHPNVALTNAAKDLLQPSNPNAGATPSGSAAANAPAEPAEKAIDLSSIAPSGTSATPTGITVPGNATTALHDLASTLTRLPTQDNNASPDVAAINAQPVNAATGDANTALAAASNTTPATTPANDTSAAANSTAADTAVPQNLTGLPAGEQVAINLKQAIRDGSNDIHIQLKPESLGAIDVKLNVNHDGRLTAVISADRSDTLNLLKQDSGTLQQSLRDAGFSADSGSLSFNLRGESQSFAQNTAQQGNASGPTTTPIDEPIAAVASYASRQTSGTIDIQA